MYLKSIEVHGFKSFANKIVFEFHNGITGIVGPNGSGKSNVADAVRWVLGEQSAKQLRGASMQDVIFAGTENRRPVSYAYVSITLDNADHVLPVEYEEVTVARRVYRSGESEYLLNGSSCRLKDVAELFYDTGIGKEGYSIIGQGQIERILSGRPEERRELFDEAAGIVKFKRRKAAAQKKLEHERENMVRIHDILTELERQVLPLEKQAEKAKAYIKKKEELKVMEVNLFLLDMEQNEIQSRQTAETYDITDAQLKETQAQLEQAREEYERLSRLLEQAEAEITAIRDRISGAAVLKGRLEGEVNVLREQIHSAQMSQEHYQNRKEAIEKDSGKRRADRQQYEAEKSALDTQAEEVMQKRQQAQERFDQVRARIALCNETIERGKNEIIELLNQKGSVKGQQQRFDMMLEQANIRNAQLNQRKLRAMSEEADLASVIQKNEQMLFALEERMEQMQEAEQDFQDRRKKARQGMDQARSDLEQTAAQFHKTHSRLETLRNIAERYDGYGGSIRRVMEQKEKEPGIHGVVADLLTVEKKYETAIETALGGSIQNIVTKDEGTAKRIVQFLKENKYGRATFLPLTSVNGRKQGYNERALDAEGVIGMANTLVKTKPQYEGVMAYLLGRIFVVDQIDHAVALAREYHYSLNIVTLEGEHLLPGGSISGGAFKNSSNLLGRKREIDELKAQEQDLLDQRKRLEDKIREYESMQQLLRKEQEKNQEVMQQAYLEHNTAKLNLERVLLQKQESGKAAASLAAETKEIEQQKQQIGEECSKIAAQLKELADKESRIKEQTQTAQKELEEHLKSEQEYTKGLSEIQVEEAALKQQAGFVQENIRRTDEELQKLEKEMSDLLSGAKDADADVTQKELEIEKLRQRIAESETKNAADETELEEEQKRREAMTARQKGFFAKQEELSEHKNVLDKEIFRLLSQKEKLEEAKESQTNYMWSEYELTPHHALNLRDTRYADPSKTKSHIRETKEEIRKLGDVNVNAIEEYKEVSQRYEFLKTQHDDLIQAEQTLLGIIEELDTGMRRQFAEKFAEIQREFDKAFKQLFGGGKGTLELAEDEEILECGISIIAHPPGKKLQNMMQLSGGEKALTAIALLFAIQNLKPSPFCLLDEIEAALDDSNVDRFAKYLHKLTKNTQFIVITHRRGTMTAADRLYGITMQEKGVSTLVSVSLIENDLS
ncbi:MAG: chromosome segregation protein SMC [Eubacterium sp.]|nr:chromosome segregation protein SMC [Eubacterium sp.]